MRQSITQWSHQPVAQRLWHRRKCTAAFLDRIMRIARKQFVTSIAGQSNSHVIACKFRYYEGRYLGRIGERLIEMPDKIVDKVADFRCDKKFMMVRTQSLRGQPCVSQLVITVFVKSN